MESCGGFRVEFGLVRLKSLDPGAYLCEVLARIAEQPMNRIEELLPWNLGTDADMPHPQSNLRTSIEGFW
jgi:hypothetical protein